MDVDNLYLMQDGTQANPSDVSADEKGVLRNKNGVAVCVGDDGKPQTIGRTAELGGNAAAAKAGKDAAAKPGELQLDQAAKPAARAQDVRAGELRPGTAARDTKAE